MAAASAADKRAEADGIVGWAETRRADGGNRQAARLGQDCEAVQVRGLALIGGHAERGVALQMLDGLEAFALRQPHIRGCHVVLQVDEGFALARESRRAAACLKAGAALAFPKV